MRVQPRAAPFACTSGYQVGQQRTQPRPRAADTPGMHTVLPAWTDLPDQHRGAVVAEMRRRMNELSAELEAGLRRDREETMRLLMAYAAALLALEA